MPVSNKTALPPLELPDQFLYNRKGPWPQPSPSHPMLCADEVLNVPELEEMLWNQTIGARYVKSSLDYPPVAARKMLDNKESNWVGPDDNRFNEILFTTMYTRFAKELYGNEREEFAAHVDFKSADRVWKYDFGVMKVLKPLDGMYCAPTRLLLVEYGTGKKTKQRCACIQINDDVFVKPGDPAWGAAKLFALQGASYQTSFVVHPSLHFPMDSVNAITKTSVPITHPLHQLLMPHTKYSLALDNGVLESANSIVNQNAQGTRFDPLTVQAYNLKLLFGAGYQGLPEEEFGNAYPKYDYMQPQMAGNPDNDLPSGYGEWLRAYYEDAFLPFSGAVADHIKAQNAEQNNMKEYVRRWANYNHAHVLGFPDGEEIFEGDTLARAMAIYMWDTSVSHGADHWSYAFQISAYEKCLRLRLRPPESAQTPSPENWEDAFNEDDVARAELAEFMFLRPWAVETNLSQTQYAFTDLTLQKAAQKFRNDLKEVFNCTELQDFDFQPLLPGSDCVEANQPAYDHQHDRTIFTSTLPQSIQY